VLFFGGLILSLLSTRQQIDSLTATRLSAASGRKQPEKCINLTNIYKYYSNSMKTYSTPMALCI
jgi:hypothetical protein